ncbi:MAG TPA: hypothetical protein VNZ86_10655, partial [Bacteroidia bacterium]|nr:hypothetical protein [Bacteroidia bacterium]
MTRFLSGAEGRFLSGVDGLRSIYYISLMKRLPYFFLSAVLFSCSPVKWSDVKVNEKYALQLPGYLEPGN